MMLRLVVPLGRMIALVLGAPVALVSAQIDPQIREQVVPAVVEIAIILTSPQMSEMCGCRYCR
jgi:hypothetical protein